MRSHGGCRTPACNVPLPTMARSQRGCLMVLSPGVSGRDSSVLCRRFRGSSAPWGAHGWALERCWDAGKHPSRCTASSGSCRGKAELWQRGRDSPWLRFVRAFPVQRDSAVLDPSASGNDAAEPCPALKACADTSRPSHGMAAGKHQLGKPQQQHTQCPGHSHVPSDGHGCSQPEREREHLPAPSSHPTSFFQICFLNEIRTKSMKSRNVCKG